MRLEIQRFSPDSQVVLTTTGKEIRLWDTASGKLLGEPIPGGLAVVGRWDQKASGLVAFSPDSRYVAVVSESIHLLDAHTGKPLAKPFQHHAKKPFGGLLFSPDSGTLLTAGEKVCLWESATGRPRCEPLPHPGSVQVAAFSRDGRTVLTGGSDGSAGVRFWESTTGKPVGNPLALSGPIYLMEYAHNGRALATATANNAGWEVCLWDPETRMRRYSPVPVPSWVRKLLFSPDDSVLLVICADDSLHLWDLGTGQVLSLLAPPPETKSFPGSLDVEFLASASGLPTFSYWIFRPNVPTRVWAVPRKARWEGVATPGENWSSVTFTPDSRDLIAIGHDSSKHRLIWKRWSVGAAPSSGEAVTTIPDDAFLSFPTAARRVVLAQHPRYTIEVWDVGGERPCGPAIPVVGYGSGQLFGPDGARLWSSDGAGGHLWDVSTGKEVAGFPKGSTLLAFSPDSKRAAVVTSTGEGNGQQWKLQIVNAATGEAVRVLPEADGALGAASLKASGPADKTARLAAPGACAFSPDGKTMATGHRGAAQRWDVETGKAVGDALSHRGVVGAIAYSADGRTLLTGCLDAETTSAEAHCWDAVAGNPKGPPLRFENTASLFVWFLPGEQTFLTLNGGNAQKCALRCWHTDTGKAAEPPAGLKDFVPAPSFTSVWVPGRVGTQLKRFFPATGKLIDFYPPGTGLSASKFPTGFSADGKRFLLDRRASLFEARDAVTGQVIGKPVLGHWPSQSVGDGVDGLFGVILTDDDRPQVWDLIAGKSLSPPLGSEPVLSTGSTHFSSDGKKLALNYSVLNGKGAGESHCRLFETATGKPLGPSLSGSFRAAFSPDGATVLLRQSGRDLPQLKAKDLILWDVAAGKPRGQKLQAGGQIDAMAFSPDGRHVWTGRMNGKIQTWDAATGKLVGVSTVCPAPLRAALAYTPDGKFRLEIFHISFRAELKVCDAATGMLIGKPLPIQSLGSLAHSPDGKSIAVALGIGPPEVWPLPRPVDGSPDRLRLWVEVLTGMELDTDGATHQLAPDAWKQRKQRLQELGGPPLPYS
jgi:WD40 repeat protein